MKPLVSFLCPTRHRLGRLGQTLQKLGNDPRQEIILMIDDDDRDMMAAKASLEREFGARVLVSKPMGFKQIDRHYFKTLEENAKGFFVCFGNDDFDFEGDWLGELEKAPKSDFIIQAEYSQLRESVYHKAEAQAFPIIPRKCWRLFSDDFPSPCDTRIHELLVRNGWKTHFLEGITFKHDRPLDEAIIAADPLRGTAADLIRIRDEHEKINVALRLRLENEAAEQRERLNRETDELRNRLVQETEDLKAQLSAEATNALNRLEVQFARDTLDVLHRFNRRT